MLEFHLSTIVFTIINLLVLFFFFRKFLFGRVNAVLEERAKLVQQELDEAKAQNAQAKQLQQSCQEKLDHAHEEAGRILAQAQAQGKKEYEALLAAAQEDARKVQRDTQTKLAAERESMLRDARQEMAQLALLAASQVARQRLDSESDRAVVQDFLKEAGETV